ALFASLGWRICSPDCLSSSVVVWGTVLVFSFLGSYLCSFPALLIDVLTRRRSAADPRARDLIVVWLGASLGLLLAISIAFVKVAVKDSIFDHLADRQTVELTAVWQRLEVIGIEAQLLLMAKNLLDDAVPFTISFILLAMFCTWVYDKYKPRWFIVSQTIG